MVVESESIPNWAAEARPNNKLTGGWRTFDDDDAAADASMLRAAIPASLEPRVSSGRR